MTKKKIDRIMGFDFGTKNIGVAVGSLSVGTSSPLEPIKSRDGIPDWDELSALVEHWQADAFVVGLPLHMDGSENEMCLRARKFGNRIGARFHKQWFEADERLTTREAKQLAYEAGHRGKYGDNPIDGYAAQLILQTWLEQNKDS